LVPMVRCSFLARGNPRITAEHRTTIEITREGIRSYAGDCIVATGAEVGLAGLPEALKNAAREKGAPMSLILEVGGRREVVRGEGDPSLTFLNEEEMVVRKSGYTCGRTLMIRSDKAAKDLDRRLVDLLRGKGCTVKVTVVVGEKA
jgi:hypothetical protein